MHARSERLPFTYRALRIENIVSSSGEFEPPNSAENRPARDAICCVNASLIFDRRIGLYTCTQVSLFRRIHATITGNPHGS